MSAEEYPTFRASVMDGYAVTNCEDLAMLRVVGKNLAGENSILGPSKDEIAFTAVYVTTGA